MKIRLEKIVVNDKVFFKPIDFENDFGNTNLFELLLVKKDNIFVPTVFIVREFSDYNYDNESIEYTYSYLPIEYNPFNGEKIEFEIVTESDKSDEYNELERMLKENRLRRKSKKKFQIENDIMKKKHLIMFGTPFFVRQNKDNIYDQDDLIRLEYILN